MRKDGRRVSGASPMYTVAAYFMKKRYDAQNMIEVDVPLNPIGDYIRAKRAEGKKVSHLGVLIAAYLRTTAEYPLLNRFIVNKRAYSRTEFTCGMVVLKPGELDGTMNKMHLELEDDVFRVQEVLDSYIDENREAGETNSTDKVMVTWSLLANSPSKRRYMAFSTVRCRSVLTQNTLPLSRSSCPL